MGGRDLGVVDFGNGLTEQRPDLSDGAIWRLTVASEEGA